MNLRLYSFCNFYLSSIQQGIQTAHLVAELWNNWNTSDYKKCVKSKMLWDWSNNHKTIIVCNGGTSKDILDAYNMLTNLKSNFPMAIFAEEPGAIDSIGSAVTGFGIILPEEIYDAELDMGIAGAWVHDVGSATWHMPGSTNAQICEYVKSKSLAR
jgi:hypothetical protein